MLKLAHGHATKQQRSKENLPRHQVPVSRSFCDIFLFTNNGNVTPAFL